MYLILYSFKVTFVIEDARKVVTAEYSKLMDVTAVVM